MSADKMSNHEPLRLDAFHNQNWRVDAQPVAVLNEASTTHERIAYCWGQANQISEIAHMLGTSSDADLRRCGGLLHLLSTPLTAMLDHLADTTSAGPEIGGP